MCSEELLHPVVETPVGKTYGPRVVRNRCADDVRRRRARGRVNPNQLRANGDDVDIVMITDAGADILVFLFLLLKVIFFLIKSMKRMSRFSTSTLRKSRRSQVHSAKV